MKEVNPAKKICGKPCEVYSRVVGYLRPVSQWNPGKKAEFAARKPIKISQLATLETKNAKEECKDET